MAFNLQPSLPVAINLGDIVAAAIQGLEEAAFRYEVSRGPFLPFARLLIRRKILGLNEHRRGHRLQGLTGHGKNRVEGMAQLSEHRELHYFEEHEQRLDRELLAPILYAAIQMLEPEMQRLIELRYLEEKSCRACIARMHVTANRFFLLHRQALAILKTEDRLKNLMTKTMNQEKARIDRTFQAAVVDELGLVQKRIAQVENEDYKADIKRERELKDEIKTWLSSDLAGDESTSFEGNRYVCNVSEQRNERYVVDGGYKKIMGWLKDRFTLHCTIPFKYLDAELSSEQQAEVIRKGHVGYRSFDTERLRTEAKKAA